MKENSPLRGNATRFSPSLRRREQYGSQAKAETKPKESKP
jgi:hypothetical protein